MDLRQALHRDNAGSRPETASETSHDTNDEVSTRIIDVLSIFWRRKILLIVIVLASMAAGYWHVSGLTPRFTAAAEVLVAGRDAPVVTNVQDVIGEIEGDTAGLANEMQLIRSRSMAARVIEDLGLDRPPGPSPGEFYFDRPAVEPSIIDRIKSVTLEPVLDLIKRDPTPVPDGAAAGGSAATANDRPETEENKQLINFLLGRLNVYPVGRSRVIGISFTSTDRVLAARIANGFAEAYLSAQTTAKRTAAEQANAWLDEQIAKFAAQVEAAEARIEDFRAESNIVAGPGATTLTSQQVGQLNSQLTEARATLAEARARLREGERLVAANAGLDSLSDVLRSPLIQSLRTREAELRSRLAEQMQDYGDRHPTDMAGLRGARIVTSIETEQGSR